MVAAVSTDRHSYRKIGGGYFWDLKEKEEMKKSLLRMA